MNGHLIVKLLKIFKGGRNEVQKEVNNEKCEFCNSKIKISLIKKVTDYITTFKVKCLNCQNNTELHFIKGT